MMSGQRQEKLLLEQIPSHLFSYLTSSKIYWFYSQKWSKAMLQTDIGSPQLLVCHSLICSLILMAVADYPHSWPKQSSVLQLTQSCSSKALSGCSHGWKAQLENWFFYLSCSNWGQVGVDTVLQRRVSFPWKKNFPKELKLLASSAQI